MKVVQSPEEYFWGDGDSNLFLGGGISGCGNWQNEFLAMVDPNLDVTIYNPRRVGDLAKDGDDAKKQILWEHNYLRMCSNVIFWFPCETLCPITLFELGLCLGDPDKGVYVGCHPEYGRRFDLEVQIPLKTKWTKIVYSLEDLAEQVNKDYSF